MPLFLLKRGLISILLCLSYHRRAYAVSIASRYGVMHEYFVSIDVLSYCSSYSFKSSIWSSAISIKRSFYYSFLCMSTTYSFTKSY